jgi:hypothetical protein
MVRLKVVCLTAQCWLNVCSSIAIPKEQLKKCRSSSKLKSIGGPDKSQPKNLSPGAGDEI